MSKECKAVSSSKMFISKNNVSISFWSQTSHPELMSSLLYVGFHCCCCCFLARKQKTRRKTAQEENTNGKHAECDHVKKKAVEQNPQAYENIYMENSTHMKMAT
jgi:hypothetical protein